MSKRVRVALSLGGAGPELEVYLQRLGACLHVCGVIPNRLGGHSQSVMTITANEMSATFPSFAVAVTLQEVPRT